MTSGPTARSTPRRPGTKTRASGTPAPVTLTCRCGYTTSLDGFDQHLIDVFAPADDIGLDGQKHASAGPASQHT